MGPRIKCNLCNSIIQSEHRHDMVWCNCKAIAIDGGNDYTKIVGDLKNIAILDEEEKLNDDFKHTLMDGLDDWEDNDIFSCEKWVPVDNIERDKL